MYTDVRPSSKYLWITWPSCGLKLACPGLANVNHLTPNDHYMGRTASQPPDAAFYIFIQQIYILNILNMLHNLRFFSLQNVVYFIMLPFFVSCIIHILNTGCAKI